MAADPSLFDSDDSAPMSAINVTPFVDVALVLLVIFMITAPALLKDTIGIHLPKASTAEEKSAASSIAVGITSQGQFLVNGKLVAEGELTDIVKKALASNPKTQAILSADAEARHGSVVKAIDLIKSAGLTRFAIQVERNP